LFFKIQLRQNKIASVERDSFAGLFTVGSVHLQSNYIGRLEPGAISGIENLGSLTLSYNTIRETLSSEECLRNQAQRFVFSENTLRCDCQMRWIQRMETVEVRTTIIISNNNSYKKCQKNKFS
jgi:hypothetical protein